MCVCAEVFLCEILHPNYMLVRHKKCLYTSEITAVAVKVSASFSIIHSLKNIIKNI